MSRVLSRRAVSSAGLFAALLFLGPVLASCSSRNVPNVGSETNWLTFCAEGQACGEGRTCRCGVCTLGCDTESECTLGARDACVAPRGPALVDACAADEATSNLCLPGCATGSSECGSGFACVEASCVPSPTTSGGNDAGGAGGASAAGGTASGGTASSGSTSVGGTSSSGAGGSSSGGAGQGSAPSGASCSGNDDCASGVCEGPGCGAGEGVCAEAGRLCTLDAVEYCSCDGATFTGSGNCPGARYEHAGPCDDAETGNAADGDACRVAADCASGICEGVGCDDPAGTCVPQERTCTRDLREYCGCDGITFEASGSCAGARYQAAAACE